MKIFEDDSKVNFVDDNNVFVGYRLDQDCCEKAGWFISDKKENKINDDNYNTIERPVPSVENYVFDILSFEEIDSPDVDEGSIICFRLAGEGRDFFLHLFNCHNGYYAHGFKVKVGDITIKDSAL